MKERTKFCLEWEKRWRAQEGFVNVSELARVFGIARQTGHVWIKRYRDANFDVGALTDRSRRPKTSPTAVPVEVEESVVNLRKKHRRWGPRKLRAWLVDRYPKWKWPSASTIGAILKRRGLTVSHRPRARRRAPVAAQPFAPATGANSVWCIDFKGQFKTGDRETCYPLTVIDAFSRLCIRCEIGDPDFAHAQRVLDSAFVEFGLPYAIRSDNGPPFSTSAPAGLSQLAAWLLRLGLRLERIQPGKPQQNGRQERFHRTLKAETASPPAANHAAQQRAFDLFRREYNEERPHESVGMKPPASAYAPSSRRYPRRLLQHQGFHVERVERDGSIRWGKRGRVFISAALNGEYVNLSPNDNTTWSVHFGKIELGTFDDLHRERGLVAVPRPRTSHCLTYDEGLLR